MNVNKLVEQIPELKEAFNELPQPYQVIDDEFLELYEEPISKMKAQFADKGGLHLIDVGEIGKIIVRVPGKTLIDTGMDKAKKQKATDAALYIVGECCLYPSIDVLNQWAQSSPGLFIPIGNKLVELAGVTLEATAKKL
jgi:hypothetical protein